MTAAAPVEDSKQHMSAVSSRDIKLHHLYTALRNKGGHKIHLDMSEEITKRMRVDHVFEDLAPSHLRATA